MKSILNFLFLTFIIAACISCSKDDAKDTPPSWQVISVAQGLIDNNTTCIFEASDKTVWVGTNSGISRFDGSKWTNYSTGDGLPDAKVRDIAEDPEGNIIVSFYQERFYEFDGTRFNFYHDENIRYASRLFLDSKNRLWVSAWDYVVMKDGDQTVHFTTEDGLVGTGVTAFGEDKSGNIWIGTFYGISKWNGSTFTNYTTEDGLGIDRISDIDTDNAGNVWISQFGSLGGVTKFDGQGLTYFPDSVGAGCYGECIVAASDGSIWHGTSYDAVFRYKDAAWKQYTQHMSTTYINYVFDVHEIGNDLWFAVDETGIVIYKNFKNEK